jgi:hypothetical protein
MSFLENAETKLARQPEHVTRRTAVGRLGRLALGMVAFLAGTGLPDTAGASGQVGCCFLVFNRCSFERTTRCPDRSCPRYRWMCQFAPDCTQVCGECYSPCNCSFTYHIGDGCNRRG